MSPAQRAAQQISAYLLTGAHHSTPDGQTAITAVVAEAIYARHAEQGAFFAECMRDVIADKDRQIARLAS